MLSVYWKCEVHRYWWLNVCCSFVSDSEAAWAASGCILQSRTMREGVVVHCCSPEGPSGFLRELIPLELISFREKKTRQCIQQVLTEEMNITILVNERIGSLGLF